MTEEEFKKARAEFKDYDEAMYVGKFPDEMARLERHKKIRGKFEALGKVVPPYSDGDVIATHAGWIESPTPELSALLKDCKSYLEPMHKNKKVVKLIERLDAMIRRIP